MRLYNTLSKKKNPLLMNLHIYVPCCTAVKHLVKIIDLHFVSLLQKRLFDFEIKHFNVTAKLVN